jgi:hypothetical protein
MWVLGTKSSSARGASALDHWAISPVPSSFFLPLPLPLPLPPPSLSPSPPPPSPSPSPPPPLSLPPFLPSWFLKNVCVIYSMYAQCTCDTCKIQIRASGTKKQGLQIFVNNHTNAKNQSGVLYKSSVLQCSSLLSHLSSLHTVLSFPFFFFF